MERRRRCLMCGTLTLDWERIEGVTRCWPCGRLVREANAAALNAARRGEGT